MSQGHELLEALVELDELASRLFELQVDVRLSPRREPELRVVMWMVQVIVHDAHKKFSAQHSEPIVAVRRLIAELPRLARPLGID